LPGPSSALAALILSGLPPDRFFFAGFLPAKSGQRRTELAALKAVPGTLIFFESAGRVPAALEDMAAVLGDRPAAVAREVTKLYEECLRGSLTVLAEQLAARDSLKGECVIVVGPPSAEAPADGAALDAALQAALAHGPVGQAASEVAAALSLPRRQVYERALVLTGKKGGAA
jgi:16S rRNA (cytidine1402-2'-O)-methyltransferase